jgi:cytoplasmic iron level regulating protein YaaA (DUF328/UPF0246 family)
MLLILSPAKTQDYEDDLQTKSASSLLFPKEIQTLVKELKALSEAKLGKTLGVSPTLAKLNYQRFQDFSSTYTAKNSRQAILAYRGDVYQGLAVWKFSEKDFSFAQEHLRIISGLYGLLRPLDRIQPYRLEMANKLTVSGKKDLYAFWKETLTEALAKELRKQQTKTIINLASKEYSSAIDCNALPGQMITCEFKEKKAGKLRVLGLFAKRARGRMASWIIHERIDQPEQLKDFSLDNYRFDPKLSTDTQFVFTRPQP